MALDESWLAGFVSPRLHSAVASLTSAPGSVLADVLPDHRVSPFADRSVRSAASSGVSPTNRVLGWRDFLKVVGIDAGSMPARPSTRAREILAVAPMIYNETRGDRATELVFENKSVSQDHATINTNPDVPRSLGTILGYKQAITNSLKILRDAGEGFTGTLGHVPSMALKGCGYHR